jgi:hypothetical protein
MPCSCRAASVPSLRQQAARSIGWSSSAGAFWWSWRPGQACMTEAVWSRLWPGIRLSVRPSPAYWFRLDRRMRGLGTTGCPPGIAQVVIQRQAMVKGRDVGADEFDDRRIGFLSRRAWIIPSRVSTPRRPPALSSTGNSCRVVWIRHCTTSSTRLSGVIARDHRIRHRHPPRDLPQLSLALTDIKGVKPLRALIAPSCTPGTCTQLA